MANQCIVLQTPLADGSPCGYGGTCSSGSCHSGSLWDTIKAWYTENLQISVPVTVVAGLFVLIILAYCFKAAFRRANGSRSRRLSTEPALTRIRGERISSWPAENSIPSGISQSRGTSPRQLRQAGPGMAGIGANRSAQEENPFLFNGPPISHPPALQPRRHRGWVDDSVYNGPEYQPRY